MQPGDRSTPRCDTLCEKVADCSTFLAKTEKWEELDIFMPKLEVFASSGSFLKQNECQLKLAYIQALKAFYHGNYTVSIEKCDWMISNYHMEFDWLKGFAYMLRGQSYDMQRKQDLAVDDYKKVLKMDAYYPEVEGARKRIKEIGKKSTE